MIVEYKSSQRYSDYDSEEKRVICEFYTSLGGGSLRFIMLNGRDWLSLRKFMDIELETIYPSQ